MKKVLLTILYSLFFAYSFALTDSEKVERANKALGRDYPHVISADQIEIYKDCQSRFMCESYAWELLQLGKKTEKVTYLSLKTLAHLAHDNEVTIECNKTASLTIEAMDGWGDAAVALQNLGRRMATIDDKRVFVGYSYKYSSNDKTYIVYFDMSLTDVVLVKVYNPELNIYEIQ